MFSVYCHTNKANNKVYIGITGQPLKDRWQGGSAYKKNQKFYADIQKYGWDGFEHRCIVDGINAEQAAKVEAELITAYDAINKGYNVRSGLSTYSTRAFNTEAGNIYRGLKHYPSQFKEWIEMFDAAKEAGVGSNLLDNLNIHCEHIVKIMKEDGYPAGYTDFVWLCRWTYEMVRQSKAVEYFSIHGNLDGFDYPTCDEAVNARMINYLGGKQVG